MEDVIVLSSDSDTASNSSVEMEMEPVESKINSSETIVPKDNVT